MSNNLHLQLDERNIIEQELNNNNSLKNIAVLLDKDPTTISKEIKKYRIKKEGQSIIKHTIFHAQEFLFISILIIIVFLLVQLIYQERLD